MLSWVLKLAAWVFNFWDKVPEKQKDKIIASVVDAFSDVFREFYKIYKAKGSR